MVVVMIKRWFFQFNWQLQADPNHPWQGVLQQRREGQPCQVSGSEGGDWEPAIMAKLNHLQVIID